MSHDEPRPLPSYGDGSLVRAMATGMLLAVATFVVVAVFMSLSGAAAFTTLISNYAFVPAAVFGIAMGWLAFCLGAERPGLRIGFFSGSALLMLLGMKSTYGTSLPTFDMPGTAWAASAVQCAAFGVLLERYTRTKHPSAIPPARIE